MKKRYDVHNKSNDTVILGTADEKYILNPQTKHSMMLTEAEYKKHKNNTQLIIREVAK